MTLRRNNNLPSGFLVIILNPPVSKKNYTYQ
jgi:hypothetical protein